MTHVMSYLRQIVDTPLWTGLGLYPVVEADSESLVMPAAGRPGRAGDAARLATALPLDN